MQRLILLASPTLRRGPLSALQRFVRDYEMFLRQFEIITTEGCRVALLRSGLLHGHAYIRAPLPGYLGGIVELSSLVVNERQPIEAVLYFIDPRDPSSIFPETNAIKRECVVHGVTFLSTSRAAREWADMKCGTAVPQFVNSAAPNGLNLVTPIGKETIALIAHDGRKRELLEFARDNFEFLLSFQQRVATGTTGTLLNGKEPEEGRLTDEERTNLLPLREQLAELIVKARAAGRLKRDQEFVDKKESGPKGGDVMIAEMVLARQCQRIIFFENPLKPHEHTEDIQLLERTGRLCGKWTICVHDQKTAAEFVDHWQKVEAAEKRPGWLLTSVLERLFGTRCILVETDKTSPGATWESIREASGWFLLSHIATLANERKKVGENLRVSVSWGKGSAQAVAEMRNRLDRLKLADATTPVCLPASVRDLEEFRYAVRHASDRTFEPTTLDDPRYFQPGNVIAAPIQGLVGSEDENVEANEIAHAIQELFRGDHVPLAANVLVKKGGDSERRRKRLEKVLNHWDDTDLVIATAGPLVEEYEDRPRTPLFPGFFAEMQKLGACGNVGPLFLDRFGREVVPDRVEMTAMSAGQLKRVKKRDGVVVIAGAQSARAEVTLAALIGGWVSVLVTDTEFGRDLIARCAALVADGQVKLLSPDSLSPLVESARL